MNHQDIAIFERLMERVERAEDLHPCFAEGVYQGLGRISEEVGELCQAVNKGEPTARVDDEAWDMLVVAWRFVRKDYEQRGGA